MAENLVSKEPPQWFCPNYPPLNAGQVASAAYEGQIITYPCINRTNIDPPIIHQKYANISFMLFDIPRRFRDKPIYGFIKVRGNHESEAVAREDAMRIVRDIDSKHLIQIAPVGQWVPITENLSCIKDLYDVKDENQEVQLRDEVAKEKERENQRKINEIKEAADKLVNDGDIYDDPESAKFYAMKRVTEMTLTESNRALYLKYISIQKKIIEQRIILKKLEQNHPEYSTEWIQIYNDERKKTGLPSFIPGAKQFQEYEDATLEKLNELLDGFDDNKGL
jgi:hypothetical protein